MPGLYAAGDASTREEICGGFTGGGSHNAAWAISSGSWAGRGAALHALAPGSGRTRHRALTPTGGAGLRPTGAAGGSGGHREAVALVQSQVLPYDKNYLRRGEVLDEALHVLDSAWAELRGSLYGEGADLVRSRQAAAMTAHARWMYAAALARPESRGMARRLDHPEQDPALHHRITVGGLDRVWTVPGRPSGPAPTEVAA
ncbi:FAD-binding protein [Streptomyces sp. CB00455]|uniref:FAD-binding protein n=1 Tax=Streptomyces sp. CB00455 TaxID=1703927 RepID=UPI001F5BC949|nr:FAD-binding protein [Streptomyces sp. CB00455]